MTEHHDPARRPSPARAPGDPHDEQDQEQQVLGASPC
jgi:hypothetical protein